MSIRQKLILMLIIGLSLLCLIAGYIAYSQQVAQTELAKSSNAVIELSKALETRIYIQLQ
ncbi:MAG: hypothetical protein HKM93_11680, partial [Desulfobacteraceae bacterium]|nr:hypothetical protein [Desulfobacteraceae bacterium]